MHDSDFPTRELKTPQQPATRREDVERKQLILARLLTDTETEGVLLLEPMNFRWFTSGSLLRGTFGLDEFPGLYVNSTQRWLLCTNTDTQRFFDEELDGLGFQVKEWPWSGNREQHLADLCFGRKVACDRPFRDCKQVGAFLDQERRRFSPFEEEQLRSLGQTLAHALEATARNISPGDSEAEIAGHLAHRLYKRGAEPSAVQIAAEDRAQAIRRPGITATQVETRCVLQATASRYGLFATASRTVAFGSLDTAVREQYDHAAKLSAYWLAAAKVGSPPTVLIEAERQLFNNTPLEHEWRLASPGWWTGRAPSEGTFTRNGTSRFLDGEAVVMRAQIGSCIVADTFVLRQSGWMPMTAIEEWPVRRYSLQGLKVDRPDMLLRAEELE